MAPTIAVVHPRCAHALVRRASWPRARANARTCKRLHMIGVQQCQPHREVVVARDAGAVCRHFEGVVVALRFDRPQQPRRMEGERDSRVDVLAVVLLARKDRFTCRERQHCLLGSQSRAQRFFRLCQRLHAHALEARRIQSVAAVHKVEDLSV